MLFYHDHKVTSNYIPKKKLHRYDEAFERETRFELATFSLEG